MKITKGLFLKELQLNDNYNIEEIDEFEIENIEKNITFTLVRDFEDAEYSLLYIQNFKNEKLSTLINIDFYESKKILLKSEEEVNVEIVTKIGDFFDPKKEITKIDYFMIEKMEEFILIDKKMRMKIILGY